MSYRDDLAQYTTNLDGGACPAGRRSWWRRLLASFGQAARSFAAGGGSAAPHV